MPRKPGANARYGYGKRAAAIISHLEPGCPAIKLTAQTGSRICNGGAPVFRSLGFNPQKDTESWVGSRFRASKLCHCAIVMLRGETKVLKRSNHTTVYDSKCVPDFDSTSTIIFYDILLPLCFDNFILSVPTPQSSKTPFTLLTNPLELIEARDCDHMMHSSSNDRLCQA